MSVDLQGTASEATFVALLSARSKTVTTAKKDDETSDGHILSKLVAYCSDQVTECNVVFVNKVCSYTLFMLCRLW